MLLMKSDSFQPMGHIRRSKWGGAVRFMTSARSDARWTEAILLTIALWLFTILMVLPEIIKRQQGNGWTSVLLDCMTIVVSMMFAMPLFALFKRTVEWPVGSRALIMAAAVVVVSLLQVTFDFFFIGFVADNLDKSWQDLARDLLRGYEATFNYILVFGVNVTLFQLALSRRKEVRQERQLTDARSAAHTAQLAALRYQLNPHFLFNALNSISALIVTKRNEDAENMTGKLSSFLRSSLACDPAELVPLESELALIEEYLDIEAVRFGERLNVEIDCDAAAGVSLVPGFLVQPLVENAIKHGVSPSRAPVTISIKAYVDDTDLHISVENDKVEGGGTAPRFERPGVGLINVEQRLEAVYGKKAKLTAAPHEGRYCATICIPRIEGLH